MIPWLKSPIYLYIYIIFSYFFQASLNKSKDGLYDNDPVTAFAIWSVMLSWIYAHPMWFFRLLVVILQKWLLIGAMLTGVG